MTKGQWNCSSYQNVDSLSLLSHGAPAFRPFLLHGGVVGFLDAFDFFVSPYRLCFCLVFLFYFSCDVSYVHADLPGHFPFWRYRSLPPTPSRRRPGPHAGAETSPVSLPPAGGAVDDHLPAFAPGWSSGGERPGRPEPGDFVNSCPYFGLFSHIVWYGPFSIRTARVCASTDSPSTCYGLGG